MLLVWVVFWPIKSEGNLLWIFELPIIVSEYRYIKALLYLILLSFHSRTVEACIFCRRRIQCHSTQNTINRKRGLMALIFPSVVSILFGIPYPKLSKAATCVQVPLKLLWAFR